LAHRTHPPKWVLAGPAPFALHTEAESFSPLGMAGCFESHPFSRLLLRWAPPMEFTHEGAVLFQSNRRWLLDLKCPHSTFAGCAFNPPGRHASHTYLDALTRR